MIKGEITVKGVQFGFERRRYGTRTVTWLFYRDADNQWQAYKSDPWWSINIPRCDLERIAHEFYLEDLRDHCAPDGSTCMCHECLSEGIGQSAKPDPEGSILP